MNSIRISVILSVKNGMPFLPEAVESILSQDFNGYELIILNDGSTDETWTYLQGIEDKRVRLVNNERNLGIDVSRNKAFHLAQAPYIAPMDADDKALPHRLATHFKHMEANPELLASGGQIIEYETNRQRHLPTSWQAAYCTCLFDSPIAHPCSIMRKDAALAMSGYPPNLSPAEDYALWTKFVMSGPQHIDNVPEVLLKYRVHPTLDRTQYREVMCLQAKKIVQEMCRWFWGDVLHDNYEQMHYLCSSGLTLHSQSEVENCIIYLTKMLQYNSQKNRFDHNSLYEQIIYQWQTICHSMKYPLFFYTLCHLHRLTLPCGPQLASQLKKTALKVFVHRIKRKFL